MRRFALLLDALSTHAGRLDKLALMHAYFQATPDPDRGWALAALTDRVPLRVPFRRVLGTLMAERIDPVLYKLSRDYVGDTAETVALLWPETPRADGHVVPSLSEIVVILQTCRPRDLEAVMAGLLDRFDATERWAFLKFLGGALRVGVSARLAKTALARLELEPSSSPALSDDARGAHDVGEIEEVWHALKPPYTELFQWLDGCGPRPDTVGVPVFRPLMLATPVEDADWPNLRAEDFAAEWKWDGIRVQIAATQQSVRMYSRTGEDVSATFPEIGSAFAGREVTADGELLVMREGIVRPFNDLQQRLNRKVVSPKLMAEHPAHVRLYDLLMLDGEDLRALPFEQRRQRLEAWHAAAPPAWTDLSAMIAFDSFDSLRQLHVDARAASIEGLMLKRRSSPYLAGRPKGHWFKWKRTALTLDCVLMYAQRGSGKRSSLYSDYTFGVWRAGATGAPELVPVGKAYSGFTDAELKQLDSFIRQNTVETFGPVRSVKAQLVLEVAFDAVQRSSRHKSGVAMRFPRIHRIRWDKPAAEADTLETIVGLIEG